MYHHKEAREVLKELGATEQGLSAEEAQQRLQQYGLNEIKKKKGISPLKIFLDQFKSFVILVLIVATLISFALNEKLDAIVILAIVILNAILGFVQEYKAEKAIEALKKLASLKAVVIRDGKEQEIDSALLVPGDIIVLQVGEKIPADARIVELVNLQTQEAPLTGESMPVKKDVRVVPEKAIIADRKNMIFSGTNITNGKGKAVVVATGMSTEIGKIAELIQEVKPELTPLQMRLEKLGKWLGIITLVVCGFVLVVGLIKQGEAFGLLSQGDFKGFFKSIKILFLTSVSLAVAAIPEGLPAVVTISLALGVQRMVKRNALVRKLPSVETLGSTTVICTDKTGTLTKNEMTVTKLYVNNEVIDVTGTGYSTEGQFLHEGRPADSDDFEMLLRIGALCNDARLGEEGLIGDPTEGSLTVSAAKAGLFKVDLEAKYPRKGEIEFTSERKRMSTQHVIDGKTMLLCKGAPDVVLSLCTRILIDGYVHRLNEERRQQILKANEHFASQALRILSFAYRESSALEEKDMIFVGLQGMIDPPREECKLAIEKCKSAGIKVVMITGDHLTTAKAIAQALGIEGKAITGQELEVMAMQQLEREVENIGIYARVNPADKMKIVEALKKKGHIVAMTGDGVNDAPALKRADIGISMGITGTDVAKEASHMILTDDNFASIVSAVEEGRGIYDNIRKFLAFLLSGNIAEVLIIFFAILFGMPLPLVAAQLLLINLVTDGLPATALGSDPFEPGAMQRKPVKSYEKIYKGMNPYLIFYPLIMTITALLVFIWFVFKEKDVVKGQTAVFMIITFFELYQAFSCRSLRYVSFRVGILKNKWLNLAVLISIIVAAAVVYAPSLNPIFSTAPLPLWQYLLLIAISGLGFIYLETSKYLKKEPLPADFYK